MCGHYSLSQSPSGSWAFLRSSARMESTQARLPHAVLSPVQIHQLFFERMANSNPRNPFTFQNDLTDAEMAILNKVAADCDSKLRPLDDRPVVFEARMRFVKSGEGQEDWMSPQLTELKARRELVVLDHVQTLQTSLGELRFQALETFIQDWYNSLVAVVPATGNPVSPAAIPARATRTQR